MTNPRDILWTDEFIERVAGQIARSVDASLGRAGFLANGTREDEIERDNAGRIVERAAVEVLELVRNPIQTITFEVRAPSWSDACAKLAIAACDGALGASSNHIRLIKPDGIA